MMMKNKNGLDETNENHVISITVNGETLTLKFPKTDATNCDVESFIESCHYELRNWADLQKINKWERNAKDTF